MTPDERRCGPPELLAGEHPAGSRPDRTRPGDRDGTLGQQEGINAIPRWGRVKAFPDEVRSARTIGQGRVGIGPGKPEYWGFRPERGSELPARLALALVVAAILGAAAALAVAPVVGVVVGVIAVVTALPVVGNKDEN